MRKYFVFTLVLMLFLSIILIPNTAKATSYPVIESSTGEALAASSFSLIVNLPTVVSSGDLLIVAACSGAAFTSFPPVGWSAMKWGNATGVGGTIRCVTLSKVAAGGETTVTLSIGAGSTLRMYQSVRIAGHNSFRIGVSTSANEQDPAVNPPNPPNLDTTQSAKTNLWLAIGTFMENSATNGVLNFTSMPTNYVTVRGTDGFFSTPPNADRGMNTAYRQLTAQVENPSAFAMSVVSGADINWVAFTIAIEPQAAAPLVTLDASSINYNRATLNGRLDYLFSSSVELWFEWGDTVSLGNDSASVFETTTGSYSIQVTGLEPETTYYFRAHSEEIPSGYEGIGETLNFTTLVFPQIYTHVWNGIILLGFLTFVVLYFMAMIWVRKRREGVF